MRSKLVLKKGEGDNVLLRLCIRIVGFVLRVMFIWGFYYVNLLVYNNDCGFILVSFHAITMNSHHQKTAYSGVTTDDSPPSLLAFSLSI